MAIFGDGRLPPQQTIVQPAGKAKGSTIDLLMEGEPMDPVTTLIVAIALLATADVAAINLERSRRGSRKRRPSR
jgi:hypothetical protein